MARPRELMVRMIETVKRDPAVTALVPDTKNSYRVGRLKDIAATLNVLPLIYADLPVSYIHERRPIGGITGTGRSPREVITYVIHMVCISAPRGDTLEAQLDAYAIADAVMNSLLANLHLRDADGNDPLAHDISVTAAARHEPRVGSEIESVGVGAWVRTTEDHSSSP